jgi:methionine sulfoxide reductase heme-binding subunit
MKKPKFTRFQLLVHAGSLVPLAWLVVDFLQDNLTANPIQALTLRTGKYALVLLILSLACTPANTLFGFSPALKVRRALGLYAFMYASIHFLIFVGLDYGFDPGLLREAIFEKPFALIGFSAFLILVALAATSTKGWMKRLGRKWTRLHQLVYLAGILVILHYTWAVKSDIRVPLLYGAVVLLLLVARIPSVRRSASAFRHAGITAGWKKVWGQVPSKSAKIFSPDQSGEKKELIRDQSGPSGEGRTP